MMQKTTKIFQLALTKILLNLGFSSDCTHNTSLANYHFTRFGYFIYLFYLFGLCKPFYICFLECLTCNLIYSSSLFSTKVNFHIHFGKITRGLYVFVDGIIFHSFACRS